MATTITHPLETLVVSNLAALLNAEKSLNERYSRFNQLSPDSHERSVLSSEIAALSSKADRLHRMIVAMDEWTSADKSPESLPIV